MIFPYITTALALAEFVPTLARLLKGENVHDVAKQAVLAAKKLTGTEDDLEILKRLQQDSGLLTRFQQAIIQLEGEIEQAYLKDTQDARARDIAIRKSGDTNKRANIMVMSAALGLISCLIILSYPSHHLSGEAVGIISTIAGIFGSCLKDAYGFEFGSSRGSKAKDSALAEMIRKK